MKIKILFKSFYFLLIYFFIFISLLQSQTLSDATIESLNEIGQKMTEATLAGKYLEIIDYFLDDVIVNTDFKHAIKGKEALLKVYKKDASNGLKYHSMSGTVEHRWQHKNEIFERGSFGMSVTTNNSDRPKAYYGSYFQIWKQQPDDSFKISYIIWNLDHNPCE